MSLSVNWVTKVITIPQVYLEHIIGAYYKLDVNQFRLDLKDIEDSEEGMVFPDTHRHNTEVTVGGVTLGRVVEIINGYTITFEEGMYIVSLTGANNNIIDVTNLNYVSIRSANSAGLVTAGSAVTDQDKTDIATKVWQSESGSTILTNVQTKVEDNLMIDGGKWEIKPSLKQMWFYADDNETPIRKFNLYDKNGVLTGDPTKVYMRVPTYL